MEAVKERFLSKVEQTDGCWKWKASLLSSGYGAFGIKDKVFPAQRISYCIFNNKTPESLKGLVIRHSCHNRWCVNPAHLSEGTYQDNSNDMKEAERQPRVRGIKHGMSKITEEQVREIRTAPGLHSEIAARYGIHSSTISSIKLRKHWAHLE